MEQIKLTEEQQELVEKNKNLAYFIKHKYVKQENDPDAADIESACFFALVKAAKHFKPEKRITFSTFASKCMHNEVLMFFRKKKRTNQTYSLDEILYTDIHGKALTMLDIQGVEDNYHFVDRDILIGLFDHLTELERKVIFETYINRRTQKEIGIDMNFSQSYISRIIQSAIRKMNTLYEEQQEVNV